MKNLRVSLKLTLGFGIITLLLVILGYIGLSAMNSATKGADTLESIYITELSIFNSISADVSAVGYHMVLYLSSSDETRYQEVNKILNHVNALESELNSLSQRHSGNADILILNDFIKIFSPTLERYKRQVSDTYNARKFSLSTWANLDKVSNQAEKELDTYLQAVKDGIGVAREFNQTDYVEALNVLDADIMGLVSDLGKFRVYFFEAYHSKDAIQGKKLLDNIKARYAKSTDLQSTIPYHDISLLADKMNESMNKYIRALEECVKSWENENKISGTRATTYQELLLNVKTNTLKVTNSADITANKNIASLEASEEFFLMILAIIIALTFIISFFLTKQITVPIRKCVDFTNEIAKGNLSHPIPLNQRDEFGQLAGALKSIPDNLNNIIHEYTILGQKISTGSLDTKGDISKLQGEFKTLMQGTNQIIENYLAVIENVPSAVVMLDANQKVHYLNAVGRAACGSSFSDKTCKQIMNREDSGTADDALEKAIATLRPAGGETIAHPQGKTVHIKYFAVPMLDNKGKLLSVMQLILDVTDEKTLQNTILEVANNASDIAQRVASTSQELSSQISQVEQSTISSLHQIESTSVAMEEMNSTVLEVAKSAGNASTVANEARAKADSGAKIVESVVTSIADVNSQAVQLKGDMQQLGQDAESINTIMNVISDIADQTNLLALNAAIEAARAGEAGRGFAVVADEVRKLAEKTMHATVEVGNAIRSVQSSVETNMQNVDASVRNIAEATEQANRAGISLAEILQLVDNSADQIRAIATAAEEQSSTSDEISQNISAVSNSSNSMTIIMGEASNGINALAEQASRLNSIIAQLQSSK